MAKIIKFKRPRVIRTELPNGKIFSAKKSEIQDFFDNPDLLNCEEKNELVKLALAVIFAGHEKSAMA